MLFVSAAFPPYAVPESDLAWQESAHLAERGLEVHVLTTRRDDVARPPGLHVHPIMRDWSWRDLPRLWRLVREVRPDAGMIWFLGWQYDYHLMATLTPLLVKATTPGARFVTHFSNLGSGGATTSAGGGAAAASLRNRLRRAAFQRVGQLRYGALLPLSDSLVVLSGDHRRKLLDIDPRLERRTALVPPPPQIHVLPDTDEVRTAGRAALGLDDRAFVFTYFARLYPRKGLEMLFEAFAALAPELPDARLAVVGGYHTADAWFTRADYPQELERLVESLGIGDRVVWSGEYSWASDDASRYLRAADAVVLPFDAGIFLHNSSFAAVAAHGLPVVGTRARATDPPIRDGDNVLLVPPRDRAALEDAMRTLYADEALRRRLGKGALELADEYFSWDRATDRIVEMLRPDGAARR